MRWVRDVFVTKKRCELTLLDRSDNLMDHIMHHIERYAKTLENATVELREEKQRADLLLYRMLPRFVLRCRL